VAATQEPSSYDDWSSGRVSTYFHSDLVKSGRLIFGAEYLTVALQKPFESVRWLYSTPLIYRFLADEGAPMTSTTVVALKSAVR
jgi:hypothetical protein